MMPSRWPCVDDAQHKRTSQSAMETASFANPLRAPEAQSCFSTIG